MTGDGGNVKEGVGTGVDIGTTMCVGSGVGAGAAVGTGVGEGVTGAAVTEAGRVVVRVFFIGSVDNDAFYGNILFDVYRLFPALGHYGPPLKTVESMERDRWYYLNMGPDSASKFLLNEASGGASRGEWTLWKMDPNQVQLVFVQGFVKNESGWFTAKLVNGEMAADQPISEKEVAETKRFIDSFKVRFSFIPFETISAPSASLADLY